MAPDPRRTLYINDIAISTFLSSGGITYTITNTGITLSNNISWTYSGPGTFLGFSTTEGASTPLSDLEVGDTGQFGNSHIGIDSNYHWYSVASSPAINPLDATDLTNTTWYLKQHPNLGSGEYFLNFTSNSASYDRMRMDGYEFEYGFEEEYEGETYVEYDVVFGGDVETGGTTWGNSANRTLTITGGADVTNSTLIAWLKANCVSPLEYFTCTDELTDLADAIRTKTGGSSSLTYPSGYVTAINGISVKHLTSYGVSLENYGDTYIDISDIPVGSWNGFSSISVDIEPTIYNGGVSVYTPPSLIEFTIDNTIYQAEDGMTWGEWVISEYNDNNNNIHVSDYDDTIWLGARFFVSTVSSVHSYSYAVSSSDIIASTAYYLIDSGTVN